MRLYKMESSIAYLQSETIDSGLCVQWRRCAAIHTLREAFEAFGGETSKAKNTIGTTRNELLVAASCRTAGWIEPGGRVQRLQHSTAVYVE